MKKAFTMAEILLSLTIIGVVAAITLPSLTGNINERTWNTQRKALYARMSQAIALMPALNGYGTLTEDESGSVTEDTAAETFLTDGLSKVLKINNICDNEHLEDCGIPTKFSDIEGSMIEEFPKTLVELNSIFSGSHTFIGGASHSYAQTDTKAAAFETANGESIVAYYNPYCQNDMNELVTHFIQPKMCANFVYDLNGNKGPNTVGKDIGFISVMYPTDSSVIAPMPINRDTQSSSQQGVAALCRAIDSDSRVPNRDELASMFYNKLLLGRALDNINQGYWSGSVISSTQAWRQDFDTGHRYPAARSEVRHTKCIKRY